ncbi:MAG: response regulator [Terriglobia bacterium]
MQARVRALLVHDEEKPLAELEPFLEEHGIEASRARNCAQAEAALTGLQPPALIFTDTVFTDGNWADVEALAERQRPAVPVIVVSRLVDLPLDLQVLESGASDFIVPPFREADLAWVLEGVLLRSGLRVPSVSSRPTTGTNLGVTQHA